MKTKRKKCTFFNCLIITGLSLLLPSCTVLGLKSGADEKVWLVPTPKKADMGNTLNLKLSEYTINNSFKIPEENISWLKDELLNKPGWNADTSGKAKYIIDITRLDKSEDKEFYTLDISQDKIKISASSEDGIHRAIGRLLCIIDSPLVKTLADGTVQCPELSIRDWPDYSLRGMHLRLISNPDEVFIKKELDVMSRLGFNFAVFEIGGHFESSTHPECCIKPSWTKAQIKNLVSYAKSRGIVPVPGINSIGHLGSGPLICPIMGMEDGKKAPVVSNLADPDFYRIYFEMMDELSDLFGNPEYFHIGTDEFAHSDGVQLLEGASEKKGHEYYAEFLERVNQHLAPKGIRPVIWHDMLADDNKYNDRTDEKNEPANGRLTFKAFDSMPRSTIINYWCYSPHKTYRILEDMAGKGFDIWVSPWYNVKGIEQLCAEGFRLGAKAVLGTTWNSSPYLEGFPATGEFAWNIKGPHEKPAAVYESFNEIFFYGRGTKKFPEGLTQMKNLTGTTQISKDFAKKLSDTFPGMKLDASGIPLEISNPRSFFIFGFTPPPEIPSPYNFKELMQNGKFKDIIISSPSSYEWIAPLTGLDKKRDSKDGIIYTPAYGSSTRTNIWGREIAVRDGKIIYLSGGLIEFCREKGNLDIPENGFVISKHGYVRSPFWDSLKAKDSITLLLRNPRPPPCETVSIHADGLKNFIIFITTEYPVDQSRSLGKVEITMTNGKKDSFDLNGRMFFSSRKLSGNWKAWIAWNGEGLNKIMALEWHAVEGKQFFPKTISISASPEGVESGLVILGGVQY